jgi:hypothetical protein
MRNNIIGYFIKILLKLINKDLKMINWQVLGQLIATATIIRSSSNCFISYKER